MTIGEKIKYARKKRGLTQKELGLMIGFDNNTADVRVAQYESGTRTPRADMLLKIAEALDVSIDYLRKPTLDDLDNAVSVLYLLFGLEMEAEKQHTNNFSIISVPDENPNGKTQPVIQFHNHRIEAVLLQWQLRKSELKKGTLTQKEYDEWLFNFEI